MPKYDKQRTARTPPHVSLGNLRAASRMTLDQVCEAVSEEIGRNFTRGALSAIENGHRGASTEILRALEVAYGLRANAIVVDYQPRDWVRPA